MAGQHSRIIKPVYFVGDILIINLVFLLSYYLQFQGFNRYNSDHFSILQLIINISWIIAISILKAYKLYRVQTVIAVIGNVFRLLAFYFISIQALNVVLFNFDLSKIVLYYFIAITAFAIIIWRLSATIFLRVLRKKGHNYRRVILAGINDATTDIVEFFNVHPEHGYRLLKVCDLKDYPNGFDKYLTDMKEFCVKNYVDEIYCSASEFNIEQLNCLIDYTEKEVLRLKFVLNPPGFNFKSLKIDYYGYIPVYIFRSIPLDDDINKVIKRLFDILFSLFVFLFIFSWLFPIIAICIKLDSKGPIFFKQKRSGLDNYHFGCYKFRSMYFKDKEEFVQATRGDSRITKIGAFLRRSSLDELPQFLNVFLGEMSIVGPRPHPLWLNEKYQDSVEKYMIRHFIKPGITGLAQVKGYRGETFTPSMMERRIKMDIFYMENWSFLLDVKIIFMTVLNIVLRKEDNVI